MKRRDAIKTMGTAALFGGLAGNAQAAAEKASAPTPGPQGGTFYRYAVGKLEAVVLTDGYIRFSPHPTFGKDQVDAEAVHAVLRDHFRGVDSIDAQLNVTIIDTGKERILVDTGYGDRGGSTTGWLPKSLSAAGYAPGDITRILISHAHPDHLYGLTRQDGTPVYPNAEVLITGAEKAFWTKSPDELESMKAAEHPRAGMMANINSIFNSMADRLQIIEPDTRIAPGVDTIDLHGHTPGHVGIKLESDDQRLLILADAANHEILMTAKPDWPFGFDNDPEQTAKTRRRIFGIAADQRIPCLGYHWSFPGIGHIGRDGGGAFRYYPAPWTWR